MNIVEQINDGISTRMATVLGGTFSELNFLIDIEKNNFKSNSRRYGCRPLAGSSTSGITNHYTLDQEFEVFLSHEYIVNPSNDQDLRDQTFFLYDKYDELLKDLFTSKAGLPNIILNIDSISLSEPDYSVKDLVILRGQFNVKYRQAV